MSLLSGRFHMSRRDVAEAVSDIFGAEVSLGTVMKLEEQTSSALEGPYEEALEAVRSSAVANVDETGFRQGSKRAWLWDTVTELLAVFRVDPNRSRAAFERLMGSDFNGIVGSDRWSAYGTSRPSAGHSAGRTSSAIFRSSSTGESPRLNSGLRGLMSSPISLTPGMASRRGSSTGRSSSGGSSPYRSGSKKPCGPG